MMMERDLRILTLFKQHYLDAYNIPLKCQYSCWGYYDGMSIEKVERVESKLYEKRTQSPISDLWYASMKQTACLEGIYNKQNIGIFRCVSGDREENGKQFWKAHEELPFVAVAFLQLADREQYAQVAEKIERRYSDKESNNQELKYGAVAYCTFDNADLVIVIHGNSVGKLEEIIWDIEGLSDVKYCHSIMGASESYLESVDRRLKNNEEWDVKECFGDDKIARIMMKIVTSGEPDILSRIKYLMQKFDKISYSEVSGHENLIVEIRDANVQSLLTLLLPGGFATHQNPLYGRGIYNIETSICQQEKDMRRVSQKAVCDEQGGTQEREWCITMIHKYQRKLASTLTAGEESLYFYYLAMIQTLNTLTQYERFGLSKDIFYLLYPSLQMFDQQLDKALAGPEVGDRAEKIKDSICKYLDFVNSVIYHTVHTDQVFLMIPGYSGTTFAIPIKLCLLYSWFVREIIDIINDSREGYRYECLLVPVMESKPQTGVISLGLPHGDRLIDVRLSQRSLYMPRDLMIILSHEVAHYVGDGIRHRNKRLENIIKTIAFVLAEGIMPEQVKEEGKIAGEFVEANKREIQKYMILTLSGKLRESCPQGRYHASQIEGKLIKACEELLANDEEGVYQMIYGLPRSIGDELRQSGKKYADSIREIQRLQQNFDKNRKELLASGVLRKLVPDLLIMYQEVFSDTVAAALLDFDVELYEEATRISEGMYFEEGKYPLETQLRENIVKYVCRGEAVLGVKVGQKSKGAERLLNELYAYNSTCDLLKEYAKMCYEDTKELLKKQSGKVNEVRDVFQMFRGEKEYSCQDIYDCINKKINEYNKRIENDIATNREESDNIKAAF